MSHTFIKDTAMKPLRRVFKSCDQRCMATGERPSLAMLPSQVCMRSRFLSISASNSEMSAVRTFLQSLREGHADPNRAKIEADFPWFKKAVVTDLAHAIDVAMVTPTERPVVAASDLEMIRASSISPIHDALNDDELMRTISGVRLENVVRTANRKEVSISWSEYSSIMVELSRYDPEGAMRDLLETGEYSPGVAKAMISALYLTGVRPVEMWDMDLMVPRTDLALTDAAREMIKESPSAALGSGIMRPAYEESRITGLPVAAAAINACVVARAPAILIVRNAKQENANRFLRTPYRMMVIDGAGHRDMTSLALASCLSRSPVTGDARDRLTRCVSYQLSIIVKEHLDKDRHLTLYSFRHSFATRMRSRFSDQECSALTGHTAVRTFHGYGEKRGSSGTRGGWTPTPDPERVSFITDVWKGVRPENEALLVAMDEEPIADASKVPSAEIAKPTAEPFRIMISSPPQSDPDHDLPSPSPWRG